MVQYHKPTKRKKSGSGGRRRPVSDKQLAQYGGFFAKPRVAKAGEQETRKSFRVMGGGRKTAAEKVLYANIATNEGVKKARVFSVIETRADPHLAREKVVVKGAVIETELGQARVTSRPGQCGVVNAVLIEEKKAEKTGRQPPEPASAS